MSITLLTFLQGNLTFAAFDYGEYGICTIDKLTDGTYAIHMNLTGVRGGGFMIHRDTAEDVITCLGEHGIPVNEEGSGFTHAYQHDRNDFIYS